MYKRFLYFCIAICLSGCSTIKPLQVTKDKDMISSMNTVGLGDDKKYKEFVQAIGIDSTTLLSRSKQWNRAEGLVGLGLLAAAAYGGFNTVYDGGNLKDAAFAAASISSLSSFIKPGPRRDATAKAGRRLSCLHEKASVFANAAAQPTLSYTPSFAGGSTISFVNNSTPLSNLTANINTLRPLPKDPVQAAAETARRQVLTATAVAGVVAAQDAEDEIREERFVITASTYRKIINDLFNSTKFNAGTFEASLNEFKQAAKQQAEQETGVETSAKAIIALLGSDDPAFKAVEKKVTKYAKAKTELLGCALLD